MLGCYENFPENIHGIGQISFLVSPKIVQKAIVAVFHRLNQGKLEVKKMEHLFPANCEVGFELGIGDEITFTFLDVAEVDKLWAEISKRTLRLLDFLCVLQYHLVEESGERAPLKFDYYLLRFAFGKNVAELSVFHERGPRRVHVEDLMSFLAELVNEKLTEYSGTLKLERVRAV